MNHKNIESRTKEQCLERIRELCHERQPIHTNIEARLTSLSTYKAILFDVYGTILITGTEPGLSSDSDLEKKALAEAFNTYRIKVRNQQSYSKFIAAIHQNIKLDHSIKRQQGIDYPEVNILQIWYDVLEKMIQSKEINWEEYNGSVDQIALLIIDYVCRVENPWIMPYFVEAITYLHNKGIKLGIVSNAQFYSILTLEALLPSTFWNKLIPVSDLQFWSFEQNIAKPSTHFFQRAINTLKTSYDINPNECLFVGNDMLKDIYASSEVGFKTALFGGDKRSLKWRKEDPKCASLDPDLIITSYKQFVQ